MDRHKSREFRRIRVREAWDETPALRGLRLEPDAAFEELHLHPGQVVHLRAPGARPGIFALANAPAKGRDAELLLRRGYSIADAIVTAATPGAWLETSEPEGPGFSIDAAKGRDVLLLATGSGITSIRALLQHLIDQRDQFGRIRLLYGHRLENDFAYQREHASWEQAKIEVVLYCSRASDAWSGRRGHIQDALRDPKWTGPLKDTVAYLSGQPAMIASAKEQLSAQGVPPGQIHLNF
jgi:sulfhydrogenase subunit gamma (sulfur reductase)